MNGFAEGVGKLDPALEKRGASAIAFRTIVSLDREAGHRFAFGLRPMLPPVIPTVDDEAAGLGRTAQDQMQLPGILIYPPERRVLVLATPVVVGRLVVATRLAPAGILPEVHRGLAIDAQALG
jgi:hypothetical protein